MSLEEVMQILKEIQEGHERNSEMLKEIYNKIFEEDPYKDTDEYLASYPS
jgi:hypothetical protein